MSNTTILTGLVGSHAYGLAHEGSDTDYLSVHVAPIDDILGLNYWSIQDKTLITYDPDHTSHELAKFCRLALKGNPTVNELLWLDEENIESTIQGRYLRDFRYMFLSQHTVNAYRGYITGQIHKLTLQDGTPTARFPKASRHVMRLVMQLEGLVAHGMITPRLEEWQVGTIRQVVDEAVSKDRPDLIEVWARVSLASIEAYTRKHPHITRAEPDTKAIHQLVVDIRRSLG